MPELPEEYKAYLKENINLTERMTQVFSGLDERIDYTNILLTKLIELQGGTPPDGPILGGVKNPENFRVGVVRISAPGTAQNLEDVSVPHKYHVVIKAFRANLGSAYVGTTKADAEGHADTSYPLWANEAIELEVDNLQVIWVDADNDGEGVVWIVEQESAWIRSAAQTRYSY